MNDVNNAFKTLVEYRATIEKEKALMEKFVLIETGKTPHENFNVSCLPTIPEEVDEQYGLTMSLIHLISGLDSTNLNLIEAYVLWAEEEIKRITFNTFYFSRMWKLNTYIIHDIKYFVDMIIAITWLIAQKGVESEIKVSSIGQYLHQKGKDFTLFDEYRDFFNTVNDIENAYKHSVPNVQNNLIGRDEPCIFALYSRNNKNIFNPELHGVSLKVLIQEFNKFYHFSLNQIEELCQRKMGELR